MIAALRKLNGTYWPVLIALVSISVVVLLLFASPWVTGALGFFLPFVALALFAAVLLTMNLRWKLWHGDRPLFFSIADIGFLLCFAAFGVYGFAYVSDWWGNLPYVLIGFVIVAVFRLAFIEFEAWWLGILLCAVLALVFGAYVAFTLFEPSWFFDFSASLLLLTGMLLLLSGSVLSLLASPTRARQESWPGWLGTVGAVFGVVLAIALVTSAVLTLANRQVVGSSASAGALRVEYERGRANPALNWTRNDPAQLLFSNPDLRVHTFTSEELGLDIVLGPRSERLVSLDVGPGDYGFKCRVPGHSETAGIHVE